MSTRDHTRNTHQRRLIILYQVPTKYVEHCYYRYTLSCYISYTVMVILQDIPIIIIGDGRLFGHRSNTHTLQSSMAHPMQIACPISPCREDAYSVCRPKRLDYPTSGNVMKRSRSQTNQKLKINTLPVVRIDRAATTTSVLSVTRYTVQAPRTVVSLLLNRLRLTAHGVRTVNGGGATDRAVLRFRRRRCCLLRRTGRCRHRLIAERGRSWPIVVGLSRFHDVSTHAVHTRWIYASVRYGVLAVVRRGDNDKI